MNHVPQIRPRADFFSNLLRQTAEIQVRVALINRFNALGTADIVSLAGRQRGKGLSCVGRELRNNADRGCRSAHGLQLSRWIHHVNPLRRFVQQSPIDYKNA
jgi:hypothetical protein